MGLFIYLVINTIAVFVASKILPGIHVENIVTALLVAIVLGVINVFLKPLLVILTLPINLLTLGLFTFVINAFLVLVVSWIVPGFTVDNFLWALAFSLIISLVSSFLSKLT
jgi:putative membrane protein